MARILLLLLFLLWMTGTTDLNPRPPEALWLCTALFLGFHLLLVGSMRLWSVRVARRVAASDFGRGLNRFNFAMLLARFVVPVWFGVGIFVLGWGWVVDERIGLGRLDATRLPGVLLGTLPPLLAWVGLWWSQYPAERALREQNILGQLSEDLPVHAPPSFRAYFFSSLRLQVLFTVVPVLMMIVVRDGISVVVTTHLPGHAHAARQAADAIAADAEDGLAEVLIWVASAGLVFLVAPEILRRVLSTQPLRDGPLRRRLEALCRRSGVRYREILFWDTGHNMGNAAVMGIVPWMRYILLSDVLIETMTDDQIEAVFAHEVGHVVHRHMIWFVIFFGVLFAGFCCVERVVENARWLDDNAMVIGGLISWSAAFWVGLGFISRRFERQADVYAARTIQSARGAGHSHSLVAAFENFARLDDVATVATSVPAFSYPAGTIAADGAGMREGTAFVRGARPVPPATEATVAAPAEGASYVGPYGATLFGSALHRVARVNNIPITKNEWLHGSIANRMKYLRDLSSDPALTGRFDQVMVRLYCGLLFALVASTVWLLTVR